MNIPRNTKSNSWSCLLVLLVGSVTTASANSIAFTFTSTGTGTLGAISFTDASLTVTAIGDTSAIFVQPTNDFILVPTTLTVSILGVGTADFTGAGVFGGKGYVFDNEPAHAAGFGIEGDSGTIGDSLFGIYTLSTSIGPVSGVIIRFSNEATTLGLLTFTPTALGTFTASAVPEPTSLLLLGSGLFGVLLAFAGRRFGS